jgi:hypothetical protein
MKELSPEVRDGANCKGVLYTYTSPLKERYAVCNDNAIKLIQPEPLTTNSSKSYDRPCVLSRAPSVNPTRPSGVAPISTRMRCFSSSSRACR